MTILSLVPEERSLWICQAPIFSREWAQVHFLIVKECCIKEAVQDPYSTLGVSIPGKV